MLFRSLSRIYRADNTQEIIAEIGNGQISSGSYFEPGFENLSQLLEHEYIDRAKTLKNDTTKNAEQDFANGKAAFLLGASDLNSSIRHNNENVRFQVYPIPVSRGEGVVMTAQEHLLCVNADSQNKEIAWDFVEFCTQRENIEAYVNAQGSVSPLTDSEQDNIWLEPVMEIIQNSESVPSVECSLQTRLQSWIQMAGREMLKGASADEADAYFEELVKAEKK